MNQFIQNQAVDLRRVMDFFKHEISTLRAGRANPAMLEGIVVDAYGAKTPLNGLANINVVEATSMTVTPWDKGVMKDIEKAIVEADLGLGVVNDGDKIRLNIPKMTEENRMDLVKKLNEKMEKSRISVRQVRDEIKTKIEKAMDEKEISEDDKFKFVQELDEEVKTINEKIKALRDSKESDIMTI